MATNFIREYLIKLGVDVSSAELDKLENKLSKFDKGIIGFFKRINHASIIVSKSYLALMQKIYSFSAGIAKADMDMQKWAKTMYMSTNSAKALDKTLSAMSLDVEDLRDVALNPELKRQYKELLALSQQLTGSVDTSSSMRGIRAITFEFQKMNLIWSHMKERIVHYLWRFLDSTTLKNFMSNLKGFNKWATSNLDRIAKSIGNFLGSLVATFTKLIDLGRSLYDITIGPIIEFIKKLPQGAQDIIRVFSTLGLALMAGPFGKILWILQQVVELIDDIDVYKKGGKSYLDKFYKSIGIDRYAEEIPELETPDWVKNNSLLSGLAGLGEAVGKGTLHLFTDRFSQWKSSMDPVTNELLGLPTTNNTTENRRTENNYYIEVNNKNPKDTVDELVSRVRNNRGVLVTP